ncbi:hypothetical protein PtA15_2A730 [Puccinia triticina]|uniref:Uncharacterized protein n=1 Tax=Puccinia triticina TaxID=208348 RepID=A0ABY7CBX9_9BASI|nr:uncharacterized protein PtA15_2A730 [Puccinia triticina]WAQ82413.1 hypothetical protein PtA15_2A730 [Puccinia triticina]
MPWFTPLSRHHPTFYRPAAPSLHDGNLPQTPPHSLPSGPFTGISTSYQVNPSSPITILFRYLQDPHIPNVSSVTCPLYSSSRSYAQPINQHSRQTNIHFSRTSLVLLLLV